MAASVLEETEANWLSWLRRAFHKKNTVELLLRGRTAVQRNSRLLKEGVSGGSDHRFAPFSFTAPEYCNVCGKVLWGPVVKQGCLIAALKPVYSFRLAIQVSIVLVKHILFSLYDYELSNCDTTCLSMCRSEKTF